MRVGAVVIAYNEEKMIRGAIEPVVGQVDDILVLITETPFYGKKQPRDNTEKIAKEYGADVIVDNWDKEHEMRNFGQKKLDNCEWLFLLDADMWLTQWNIEALKVAMHECPFDGIRINQYGYWHDIDHVLEGDEFAPLIAAKPSVSFYDIANTVNSNAIFRNVILDHVNWVKFKDIYKKVTTYGHANEINGHDWYHDHYKNWKYGDKAITPCGKEFNVIKHRLPDELRKFAKDS